MQNKNTLWARRAGVVAAALLAGSAVAGEGPRYTYGELGYSRVDFDNFSEDANLFNAAGSLAVTDRVHLIAGYSNGSIDGSGVTVDLESATIGAGVNFPLNEKIDLVADAAYAWAKVDANKFGSNSDDGYALNVGLRAMLTPQFELNGGGTYVDIANDDTAAYVGAVYNFTDMLALSGNISVGDNATAYSAGLRLYFDPNK
jgi:hypothetical protein